jgi:hypothetical protein
MTVNSCRPICAGDANRLRPTEPVAVRAEIGDLREEARRLRALTRKAIEELRASGHHKKAADLERELLEGGFGAVRPGDPSAIL